MANRFVSAGTAEEPPERDDEWLVAQRELDENARRKKEEAASASLGLQDGGKTLFEVLQANKAAKQDAFEESAKLKNQFRSLDEDEVDFLDSVMESTRKKEEEVRKETTQQLDAFRRQREEAERKAGEEEDVEDAGEGDTQAWRVGARKRKRKESENLKGVKLRKTSSAEAAKPVEQSASTVLPKTASKSEDGPESKRSGTRSKDVQVPQRAANSATPPKSSPAPAGLGLVAYSSDED